MSRKTRLLATFAAAITVALVGCGGPDSLAEVSAEPGGPAAPLPTRTADAGLRAAFPDRIQQSGTLRVGVSPNFAPLEFKAEDGSLTGAEIELSQVLGQATGLRIEFVETNFAGLLSGLSADRFDVVISGVTDTRSREEQITFVNFSMVGKNLLIRAEDADAVKTVADLCGRTLGETIGTTYVDEVKALSAQNCEASGKPPIQVQTFDTGNDVKQAVATSRVDGTLGAVASNKYTAQLSEGALATAGPTLSPGLSGALVPKDDPQLAEAMRGALQSLVADGTVRTVMDRWGMGETALPEIRINGADS
jgi:polar amino acid transport system substrate-binding protein